MFGFSSKREREAALDAERRANDTRAAYAARERVAEAAASKRHLEHEATVAAQRDHQLAMIREVMRGLEVFVEGQIDIAQRQSDALVKLAEATQSQATAFAEYFKMFQTSAQPTSTTRTDEDEWKEEREKLRQELGLGPGDDPEALPEEFKLALELQANFAADVLRDNTP